MKDLLKATQPRLLALRALKLGDLLVAVPALKGLRRGFPDHRIVLAAPGWLAPIVKLIDAVDELLPTSGLDDRLPSAPGIIDTAVNLHGKGAESQSVLEALAPRLMISHWSPARPEGPVWVDGMHERRRWTRLVMAFGATAAPNDVTINVPSVVPIERGAAVVHVGGSLRIKTLASRTFRVRRADTK